jgi:CubicO group peptidase (beta-lactamase class C family)
MKLPNIKLSKSLIVSFIFLVTVLTSKFINPFSPTSHFKSMPPTSTQNAEFTQRIDDFFSAGSKKLGFSGYDLISQKDRIWEKGYGRITPKIDEVPTSSTLFRIGSVTKPITAMAVLVSASEGKISLEDTVCKYLSCFCEPTKKSILIKDLLNHTSGLPHDFDSISNQLKYLYSTQFEPLSKSSLFWDEVICNAQTDASKFGKANYSNLGYATLGKILQIIEKKRI